ncbi:hypothetical protein LJR039_004342 [Pseudorhodoferax sp. LjRoot39]|uniref:hypothetical protein n=1 Tax=Pseudorhodoferax sp. LjRoot39 TaxID=3342328 RepID=UPI003ECFC894
MSLPNKAIDHLFQRLSGAYMAAWDRALGNSPLNDVKSAWAHELAEFGRSHEAMTRIAWALDNLPDHPPSAPAFKRLCRSAPAPEASALPMPKADPERVKAELAKMGHLRKPAETASAGYHKQWAHRILDRHAQGDKILPNTLKCAQDAVRSHLQPEGA